jgi:hypothetical protein
MNTYSAAKISNPVSNYSGNSRLDARYRERATGIGYGKSSGYASAKRYADTGAVSLVRVR